MGMFVVNVQIDRLYHFKGNITQIVITERDRRRPFKSRNDEYLHSWETYVLSA